VVATYFVCAEALANAAKHAAAARVTVAVTVGAGQLRVETFGGTLRVESTPGHGTRGADQPILVQGL
jgi:signal transduction histidine kinase